MLPDVVFGCLKQIIPDRVPAEGTSCLWNSIARRDAIGRRRQLRIHDGGDLERRHRSAARQGRIVRDCLPERRARHAGRDRREPDAADLLEEGLRPGSGGVGRTQGGQGRSLRSAAASPAMGHPRGIRPHRPPAARARRWAQRGGRIHWGKVRQEDRGKGFQEIPPGDRLVVHTPGGGGIGAPDKRKSESVVRDLADELISEKTARDLMGLRR